MSPATEYDATPSLIGHIKDFESCRLVAYPDPKTGGKPWTCGWGSTGPDVGPGTVWTQEYADKRLLEDIHRFVVMAQEHITAPITSGVFDAMVDILYNVGPGNMTRDGIIQLASGKPSTLLRKLNAEDYAGAKAEYMKWVSPGSNVENGLRRRRTAALRWWDL